MSTNEERRILDDIKKTGYPLEVDVARWLMEKGWSIFPQYAYTDKRTAKIRSIDMLALIFKEPLRFFEGKTSLKFPILAVECKKSEKPWVFFTTPYSALSQTTGIDVSLLTSIIITSASLLKLYIEKNKPLSNNIIEQIQKIHFFDTNLPRAYTCYIPFRNGKEDSPNDFQKAIYQVRGACLQVASQYPITPVFATVVFRGKLFEYKIDERVIPTKHLLYTTMQMLPESSETSRKNYIPPIMIDIVADKFFSNYLELIKKDFEVLKTVNEMIGERS